MIGWTLATLGGTAGVIALIAKGVLSGTIAHLWKRFLHRREDDGPDGTRAH